LYPSTFFLNCQTFCFACIKGFGGVGWELPYLQFFGILK
jgi:hypothetical protein